MSEGGGMVLLLMILGALMVYLLFSKGFWMDRFMRSTKWEGDDITPEYNTNQKIDEAISQENQEGIPYTPSLDIPFNDPEVPNRPSKKKTKKTKPKGKKRVYKKRSKK